MRSNLLKRMEVLKGEIREAMIKEVVTKAELEAVRNKLLGKIDWLYEKTEEDKAEMIGRIDKISLTLRFLIILVLIAMTLMNPFFTELLKNIFKLF